MNKLYNKSRPSQSNGVRALLSMETCNKLCTSSHNTSTDGRKPPCQKTSSISPVILINISLDGQRQVNRQTHNDSIYHASTALCGKILLKNNDVIPLQKYLTSLDQAILPSRKRLKQSRNRTRQYHGSNFCMHQVTHATTSTSATEITGNRTISQKNSWKELANSQISRALPALITRY